MKKLVWYNWAEVVKSLNLTTPEGNSFYNGQTKEPLTLEEMVYLLLTGGENCPYLGAVWENTGEYHKSVVHINCNYKDWYLMEYKSTRTYLSEGEYIEESAEGKTTNTEILYWLLFEMLPDTDRDAIYSELKAIEEGYPEGKDPDFILSPESRLKISYEEGVYHIVYEDKKVLYSAYTKKECNVLVLLGLLSLSKVEKASYVVRNFLCILMSLEAYELLLEMQEVQ